MTTNTLLRGLALVGLTSGMLTLYPREGPVYSASGGSVTTTRDSRRVDRGLRQEKRGVGDSA